MADSKIQIAPESTGPEVDTQVLINGFGASVHRQTITVGDSNNIAAVQTVQQGGSPSTVADGMAIVGIRPDSGGTTGLDFTANEPTWPVVGANFGSFGGPYDSWILLATIPAQPSRLQITIDNMSSAQILCLRDDGTAGPGAALVNATGFTLNPKVSVGPEGGNYSSATFRGRIQIYGASSSQTVAVSTD